MKTRIPLTQAMRKHCMILMLLSVSFGLAEGEAASWGIVGWVADGDTIVLTDGRHIRYIGIDTPEIDHENNRAQPMGYEARSTNCRLVENHKIRLEYDRDKKDRYGRTLAYVYRSDGLFVNAELLRLGCGHARYQYPNIDKEDELINAQRDAMAQGRGLWAWVDKKENPGHAYLGNRRSKRFHVYGCPNSKRVSPKNRIWLVNQWEAFWHGYAPARGCIVFPPEKGGP